MAKFKVILERVKTITKQGTVIVEASTAEEARRTILADLEVDPGSYDDHLEPIESGIGDIKVKVAVESRYEPAHIPEQSHTRTHQFLITENRARTHVCGLLGITRMA